MKSFRAKRITKQAPCERELIILLCDVGFGHKTLFLSVWHPYLPCNKHDGVPIDVSSVMSS